MTLHAPKHLPTLADVRGAAQKPTKLDALQRREAMRAARVLNDAIFRKAVIARDGAVDRITGKKVAKTTEVRPNRLEVHHIEGRRNKATRTDPRNGIVVSLLTHAKLTAHVLQIIAAKKHFYAPFDSAPYYDASDKLQILDTETGIRRWV